MCNNCTEHNANPVNMKTSIFNPEDIEVSYFDISKYDKIYINSTIEQSKLSYCKKLQVGCIITKDNRIISNGYNGTLTNTDNNCEDLIENELRTKISVFHAEENAIYHMLRNGISTVDCTLYCTHSPCQHCAKLIAGSNIKTVYFIDYYKDLSGIALLIQLGVKVIKVININDINKND